MLNHTFPPQIQYYLQPGPLSKFPFDIAASDLPDDIASLVKIVQGLLVHIFWADRYGLHLTPSQKDEVNKRSFAEKFPILFSHDPSPITQTRPLEKRLVGNCRDFSNFMAALLKIKGIPARARCGFGTYFEKDLYIDHWVAEYWNSEEARWIMVDAQLDELQQKQLNIRFNPLEVPPYEFLTGGKAWLLCRSGQADAKKFGIMDMWGLWFVRGDLVRDFLALNRLEILPWDGVELINKHDSQLKESDITFLDHIAGLTLQPDQSFDEILDLYTHTRELQVPASWLAIAKN
jgi:hypothetical protein